MTSPPPPDSASPHAALTLLFQDEHLVAVDKPSGLSVHKGWDPSPDNVMRRLRDQLGQHVYPVHRLDRGTSGVLLFALSSADARACQEAFQQHQVTKRYIALVRGRVSESGLIDNPVPTKPKGPRADAQTRYHPLATYLLHNNATHPLPGDRETQTYSLVQAEPITGRLHQIRRHLKHISHHLVGDVRYGKGPHNRYFRDRFGFHRLALHASDLTMPHPITGETLALHAPLPSEFDALCQALEAASTKTD